MVVRSKACETVTTRFGLKVRAERRTMSCAPSVSFCLLKVVNSLVLFVVIVFLLFNEIFCAVLQNCGLKRLCFSCGRVFFCHGYCVTAVACICCRQNLLCSHRAADGRE